METHVHIQFQGQMIKHFFTMSVTYAYVDIIITVVHFNDEKETQLKKTSNVNCPSLKY